MNIQNGKFYDAVKMREFCDGWKDLVVNYIDKKETTDGHFSTFNDTESFRGMTADQSKLFVKKGMGRMLRKVAKTQIKMRKAQAEVMELFENMVDPSQNARIEYDTLELINNDFKELYYIYKDRADNVRRIVDCLNNEFGNYAYFEQPDSQTGLDAFYDFCGGDSDTAGYIRNCQNKLAAFDATAKALLTGKDTMDNAKKINTHIVYTKTALAPAPAENIKTGKVTLDPVDNSKATANAKKKAKDDMYSYLQSYYGFTDDEMDYLKANYPNLLTTLYNAQSSSTRLEMRTYEKIRIILNKKEGKIDITNDESRANINSKYLQYYDNNVKNLVDKDCEYNGKFDSELDYIKKIYNDNYDTYQSLSEKTGVPAELICAIHYRESGCDFDTYLHNGQKLGTATTIYPQNVLYYDFEEAAVAALEGNMDKTGIIFNDNTDLASYMVFAEAYNGFGYANNNHISPYLYSGTNIYTSGKYVQDSSYNPNCVDKQLGVYCIVKELKKGEK